MKSYITLIAASIALSGCVNTLSSEQKAQIDNMTPCDKIQGLLTSFNDAEDGIKEEFQEITYAIGLEYRFAEAFSIRSGYFNENENKG